MNVLIINASPRKKGITSTLLDEVKRVINPTYRIDTVRIQDLEIRACTGCLKCRPDKPCVLPRDDAHIAQPQMKLRATKNGVSQTVERTTLYFIRT